VDAASWVQELGTQRCLDAMKALVGAVNSSELRSVVVDDATFAALADGTRDVNPKVRWWSVQLLDHIPDGRAVAVVAEALDDPVPRVRRNAAHALSCRSCKPGWDGSLPEVAVARLRSMATSDPNAKVRAEAARALACPS
jgi:HEAT repeat protein